MQGEWWHWARDPADTDSTGNDSDSPYFGPTLNSTYGSFGPAPPGKIEIYDSNTSKPHLDEKTELLANQLCNNEHDVSLWNDFMRAFSWKSNFQGVFNPTRPRLTSVDGLRALGTVHNILVIYIVSISCIYYPHLCL